MQPSGYSTVCHAVGASHSLMYLAQYPMLVAHDTGNRHSLVDAVLCALL